MHEKFKNMLTPFEKFKDHFSTVTADAKERLGNPFIISFAIVWLCYNWELIVLVNNFPKDADYECKTILITQYIIEQNAKNEFWLYPLGLSFASIASLGLATVIATWISKFFNQYLLGLVNYYFKKNAYVKMSEYVDLQEQLSNVKTELVAYKKEELIQVETIKKQKTEIEKLITEDSEQKTNAEINQHNFEQSELLNKELETQLSTIVSEKNEAVNELIRVREFHEKTNKELNTFKIKHENLEKTQQASQRQLEKLISKKSDPSIIEILTGSFSIILINGYWKNIPDANSIKTHERFKETWKEYYLQLPSNEQDILITDFIVINGELTKLGYLAVALMEEKNKNTQLVKGFIPIDK